MIRGKKFRWLRRVNGEFNDRQREGCGQADRHDEREIEREGERDRDRGRER